MPPGTPSWDDRSFGEATRGAGLGAGGLHGPQLTAAAPEQETAVPMLLHLHVLGS